MNAQWCSGTPWQAAPMPTGYVPFSVISMFVMLGTHDDAYTLAWFQSCRQLKLLDQVKKNVSQGIGCTCSPRQAPPMLPCFFPFSHIPSVANTGMMTSSALFQGCKQLKYVDGVNQNVLQGIGGSRVPCRPW